MDKLERMMEMMMMEEKDKSMIARLQQELAGRIDKRR